MRKHTLYLLLAGWGLLAASCYDDKSTLQTTHIPPVEIEVPEAIASQLTVVHNARLDITGIRITKDGRENPEELTYEWTVSQTDNDSEAISLATTREFHEVIDLPISSKGYLFLLTVTDTAHDLKYQYKWTLIVTAQFNEGLVVAYTRDGTTSDLGLIMHPQLTETYSGAEQGTVEKELISRRNGSPFPSAVTHMLYTYDKTDKKNILWVSTDDDLMRVETDYYEILGHKEDAFVYLPGKLDIRSLLNTYQCTMILNDGDIYETLLSRGRISRQRNRNHDRRQRRRFGPLRSGQHPQTQHDLLRPGTGQVLLRLQPDVLRLRQRGFVALRPGERSRPAMHRGRHQHRQRHPYPADAES